MKRNQYKKSRIRKKKRIRSKIGLVLKAGAGLAILCLLSSAFIFGYDFLTQCRYFKASQIIVEGNNRLSDAEVIAQARIEQGANILSINLAAARKCLLVHTWIAEASIRRDLPDHILITIDEHRPLAILDLGRKLVIDAEGVIFKEQADTDPKGLPVISGLTYSDIDVDGQPRSSDFEAVMQILQLGNRTESILPNSRIERIQVDREMGITVFTTEPTRRIMLGFGDFHNKYDSLKSVLHFLNEKRNFIDFASIDLNNLDRIVVGPT